MQEPRQARTLPRVASRPRGNGKQNEFDAAWVAVLGRSMIATAVTEGYQHLVRYVNPAFLELAGDTDHPGLGRPLYEQFPKLAADATRTLLDRVHRSGEATSHPDAQPYSHPRRGTLFLALLAWPCTPADGLNVTLIQYVETTRSRAERNPMHELARELRAVNEQLLVSGVREHEFAEEAERRMVVAEDAAQRSENARQADFSHELHPTSLHGAGLPSALRRLCAEIEQSGEVEFRAQGDLANLPGAVSLTLYRVAQEALQNVTRHAKARHTDVALTRDANGIQLDIKDDGRGFVNIDEHHGLGLQSMEERMRIVNGDLAIDSRPGGGTCVCARVPSASLVPLEPLAAESRAAHVAHGRAASE